MNAKRFFLLLWFFVMAVLVAGAQAAPIKVLIVEGVSNHDWKHRVEIVRAILARDGSFDVDVTVTPSTANDPGWATWRPNFSAYDVVISGYTDINGALRWPTEVETAFVQYVNSGGGFYSYHEAMSAFPGWTEYTKMLGLGWRSDTNGSAIIVNPDQSLQIVPPGSGTATAHGNRVDVEVKRLNTHPINAGLPSSWMVSQIEIYRYARGPAANMTVLSYALDPGTQKQFPIDWVVNYGQGRCYATSYGHVWSDEPEPIGTRCVAFQTLFVRALKWLAKRDPGTAVPADFPTPTAVSLRPYEEGVSGLDGLQSTGVFANGKLPTQAIPQSSVKVQQAFPNLAWESPIQAMVWPGSTTDLAIAEMNGVIYRLADNDTTTVRTPVLDIQDRVQYQNWTSSNNTTKTGGIFSMAFHPKFGTGVGKDYLYVYYIYNANDSPSAGPPYYDRLSRFTWNPTTSTFTPASELIMTNQYDTVKGHDGGGLAFGADGFLYFCVGDEGSQDGDSTPDTQKLNDRIRSGVWRLDVDQQGGSISHPIRRQPANTTASNGTSYTQGYYIPNSNPWQDPTGGTLEEFYAVGLRNPLRMTFDATTGAFWIGDVGGGQREEVDVLDAPGLNYGWNYAEGNAPGFRTKPSPLIGTDRPPVYDYPHTTGNCVIGGHIYRGTAIPFLRGKYIFGDNGTQRIYALDYNPTTRTANSVTEIGQGRSGVLWTGMSSFGIDSQGETLVLQMGGGASGGGRISRLKPQSTAPDDSHFPATLSATGLFSNIATATPAAGLIPYDVNMPLWSAGTSKRRWVMVPNDGVADTAAEQITYSENDPWALPVGSVFVKEFSLPDTGRRLETRVLIHGTDGAWGGISYRWRSDGSDADALEAGGTEPVTIDGETFDYLYPARSQCSLCHSPLAGYVLGFRTRQLNHRVTYAATGRTANQVETLAKLGLIPTFVSEVDLRNTITSADRSDPSVSDVNFVRSYLDANCSHCHQPGGTLASFDARLTTALSNQNLLCGAVNDTLGIPNAAVIKPGRIADSIAFHRMDSISAGLSMPPIAKGRVDDKAVTALANWIMGMQADCCTVAPVFNSATISVGNGTVPGASPLADTYLANMVINYTDSYTNTSGAPLLITFDRFKFHASAVTDPVTPFVVRVNSTTDFTVRAVGTSRSTYALGVNDFPFSTTTQQLTLAVGEKIAMGFLDALPDGTGGGKGAGPITYNNTGDAIHYSGGTTEGSSGKVTVGAAPVFGAKVSTNLKRNYFYAVTFGLGTTSVRDDDHDGLPDSWELAFAPNLTTLSATGDYDHDGISDADELLAGTDPFDPNSRFQVRELRPDASIPGVVATFDSVPGRSYSMMLSTDLKTWQVLGSVRAANWPAVTTAFQIKNADLPAGTTGQLFIKATTLPASP
jgi:uncharacterized repeat protein (TIGR03806 family)